MNHVANVILVRLIEKKRSVIDSFLDQYGFKMGSIYDHMTDVVPIEDFPVLMIDEFSETRAYVDAPGVIESRFTTTIRGYVHLEDNQENAEMIRAFAASLMWALEMSDVQTYDFTPQMYRELWPEHEIQPQIFRLHYHSEVPAQSMSTDYALIGSTFCRSFNITWTGYITRSAAWALGV